MAKKSKTVKTVNAVKERELPAPVIAPLPSLSPPGSDPVIETPPEVLGVSPPAATLSEGATDSLPVGVVMDASGQTFEEGDIDFAPSPTPEEPPVESPSLQVSESPRLDSTHPAIALAQRHPVVAGAPRDGAPRYVTPPPPDMFKRKQTTPVAPSSPFGPLL